MMGKYYSGIEFQYLESLPVLYLGGEYIYCLSMSQRDFEPKQKQDADIIETHAINVLQVKLYLNCYVI